MASQLRSYLLAGSDDLWDTIQGSPGPVDRLSDCSVDAFETLVDYLVTECRGAFPGLRPHSILGNCTAVSQMTWHEAKVLRTRIGKLDIVPFSQIMLNWGKVHSGGTEWADFLARQHSFFTSDQQRLVMVISNQTPLLDNPAIMSLAPH
jgi:hypothetical protein